MICPKCEASELFQKEVRQQVSIAGIISIFIIFAGVVTFFAQPLLGVVIVILGFVVSAVGRGKVSLLVCPKCKNTIKL